MKKSPSLMLNLTLYFSKKIIIHFNRVRWSIMAIWNGKKYNLKCIEDPRKNKNKFIQPYCHIGTSLIHYITFIRSNDYYVLPCR